MGLVRSFAYALAGLGHLLRTQRNFRVELGIAAAVVAAAAWLRLERLEWVMLGLTVAMVLVLEAVNTAIEEAVTLASPGFDPKARTAKDVSAAAVLIAAVASVVIGVLLFGPRLAALLG